MGMVRRGEERRGEGKGGKGAEAAKAGLSCPEIAAIASSWTSRTDRTCPEPQATPPIGPAPTSDPCCELYCADRRAPCDSLHPWQAATARYGERRSYRLVDRCLSQNRGGLCAAVAANKQTNKQTTQPMSVCVRAMTKASVRCAR